MQCISNDKQYLHFGYLISWVLLLIFGNPINAQSINTPKLPGIYYEDTVPDTLDLAEQAKYGLNYFTEFINPDLNYEMYFGGDLTHFYNHITSFGACQCKAAEAMCFERLMTGSKLHLDREEKMLEKLISFFADDGLYWVSSDTQKKPWMKIPEPFVMVHGQGRMLRAMIAWYQYTGDKTWKQKIDKLVEGLEKIVVQKEDYAYVPIFGYYEEDYFRSCYTEKGWKDIREPVNEKDGEEGSLFNHQGHLPGALATWYKLTGNEKALELSGKLARFLAKPKFWNFIEINEQTAGKNWNRMNEIVGSNHAIWYGHFHGHINTLRAILEYAIASNDQRLKEFVRDGYEWSRKWDFAKIGYVGDNQGCGSGRLIGLAVKLSNAGIGDYWEDVDQYIRNLGSRQQFIPEYMDFMKEVASKQTPPAPAADKTFDNIPQRLIGGFGGRASMTVHWLCCGTHGNMGLFYAWDSTVRYDDKTNTARINLLLNRASPWLDIYSHLPYEGKVKIKNKKIQELFIRIPLWLDKAMIKCNVNGTQKEALWFDRYLRLSNLSPKDEIILQFPMIERTEEWVIPFSGGRNQSWAVPGTGRLQDLPGRRLHKCRFKGNTLVDMEPDIFPGSPVFKRDYLLEDKAPFKKVSRYVTNQLLQW